MSTDTAGVEAMVPRFNYVKSAPDVFKAMTGVEAAIRSGGLDDGLLHLVKLRASQINGCAYCIDLHWKDARAGGETEMRLYALNAWRESPFYTPRERAALEWTEAMTLLDVGHVSEAAFAQVRAPFNDRELADLSWAIASINAWNRMAIAFRAVPGKYTPPARA